MLLVLLLRLVAPRLQHLGLLLSEPRVVKVGRPAIAHRLMQLRSLPHHVRLPRLLGSLDPHRLLAVSLMKPSDRITITLAAHLAQLVDAPLLILCSLLQQLLPFLPLLPPDVGELPVVA